MRLLVLNPNTSPEMTDKVIAVTRPLVPAGTTLIPATGRFGARYIASRAASAIAAHAALDAFAEHGAGVDGVLLACFGDPGLDALKELAPVPVVGLAEASMLAACALGRRFAIATGGERWGPMLEEFVASRGLRDRLSEVRTVAPTGADILRDPEGSIALLAEACLATIANGAEVVILGGAGLAGLAERVQPLVPVPVLCSARVSMSHLLSILVLSIRKSHAGSYKSTPFVESIGLSPALAARLAG